MNKVVSWFCLFLYLSQAHHLDAALSLSLSGNPSLLHISTAIPGLNPMSVTDQTTSYNITTMGQVTSIVGSINTSMPSGMTLSVQFNAPTGATSAGTVNLSTTAATLVSSIPKSTSATNLLIHYTLAATVAASPLTGARIITYTLQ